MSWDGARAVSMVGNFQVRYCPERGEMSTAPLAIIV